VPPKLTENPAETPLNRQKFDLRITGLSVVSAAALTASGCAGGGEAASVDSLLVLAAFAAGALNAVAGGGSFITLPALLWAGISPVAANATSTFALWPGSLSSAWTYRREIARWRAWLAGLGAVGVAGGLLGGLLLVRTSDDRFVRLLPWLMLLAAATFTFSGRLTRGLRPDGQRSHPWWALGLQLAIAVYGGYFGGGMGIMMLASLALAGLTDIHEANGIKSVLAAAINGVALAEFMFVGIVAWRPGALMMAGAIAGGYLGASLARRLHPRYVRAFVIGVAWTLTAYFFHNGSGS
jgi:uncharacterized membrane protein YfcA